MEHRVTDSGEKPYPWLRLLELELRQEPKPAARSRPGRPRNPFPRKRVRTSLTDDELAVLDELVDFLSEHMARPLHRGHLIAFMAFRLRNQLQREGGLQLDPDIHSFMELAKYLDDRRR